MYPLHNQDSLHSNLQNPLKNHHLGCILLAHSQVVRLPGRFPAVQFAVATCQHPCMTDIDKIEQKFRKILNITLTNLLRHR